MNEYQAGLTWKGNLVDHNFDFIEIAKGLNHLRDFSDLSPSS